MYPIFDHQYILVGYQCQVCKAIYLYGKSEGSPAALAKNCEQKHQDLYKEITEEERFKELVEEKFSI